MAEMSPSGGGGGPPVPAVRSSSLQPQPRPNATTTQAVVHHSATPQQQQRNHQVYQQQQQPPQHLQPQVIVNSGVQQQQQQQHPQATNNQILVTSSGLVSGPRLVVLHRHNGDFGFTLRHFIVYPPPEAQPDPSTDRLAAAVGMPNFAQPMDTVFVKKVHPNSPAFLAGLQEGDRLLAVNGLSVASMPYAQVVATIQQTPKTLTLQVVPKNYDLLQTYFSETAYNPETNQRPQPQQLFIPKASSTPTQHRTSISNGAKRPSAAISDVQEKQESLYSTLQEIVESAVAVAPTSNSKVPIYAEVPKIRSPPVAAEAPKPKAPVVFDFDPVKQQQYLAQQKMLLHHSRDSDSISSYDSIKSAATLSANDVVLMGGGDSAIMSRLRKSFEQKEEFLRRPAPAPTSSSGDVQQREFYGRPNRLQKSVWPPPQNSAPSNPAPPPNMPVITNESNHHQQQQQDSLQRPTKTSSGTQTASMTREQHTSAMSAIREQFFAGTNGHDSPKSAPPSLLIQQQQQNQQLSGSQSALPLSPASMHLVSEKAKLFESGRPLSPDGIDRAELYKSELSRMNPKQVVPNVAVRRKEFELKAESTGWRRSTEEKPRSVSSDSESRRTPVRVRSLSVESSGSKDPMASFYASSSGDDQHGPSATKDHPQPGGPGSCTLLRQRPVRENSYRHAVRNSTDNQVVLRQKQQNQQPLTIEEDERKTRRISYLRATAHDNLLAMMESSEPSVDSSPMSLPPDTPDTEPEAGGAGTATGSGGAGGDQLSLQANQQQQQQAVGQLQLQPQQPQQLKSHSAKSKALAHFRDAPADPSVPVTREGELNVKVTLIDGKRSQDRSWRTVHAELRGTRLRLTLLRDGKSSSSQSPEPSGIIDLTNFHVAEGNYTKRKNVFKLTTVSYAQQNFQQYPPYQQQHGQPTSAQSHQHLAVHHTQSGGGLGGSSSAASSSSGGLYRGYERELLLQADSQHDMRLWMDSLRTVCRSSQYLASADYINNLGGQQAEPQRVAALTSVQSTTSTDEFSPVLSAKSHRKYALGSRSPSGQSPVTKSRKTPQQSSAAASAAATTSVSAPIPNSHHHQQSQHHTSSSHSGKESSDKETGSPKSKTWKGIVARQFRKMQGQPGSPGAQNAEMLLPDGASINVPLAMCPPSEENPYVPLLLAKCTGIVESKGLSVTGIYRIPGNTAAITALTEQINRGMDEITLRDPKWEDVNIVSSLLKLFIRNLPEPLLPNDLYNSFIAADRLSGQARLIEIKALLARIPTYNYETLKHLMRHLYVVSTNAAVNLMNPCNLAIVFGPSVVRSANESLEAAVKDMKHQCQIVEVLVNHYTYFFEDDLLPAVEEKQSTSTVDSGLDVPSASLLLDNVSKIEPFKDSSKESSSHFVAQIVQAANRKIRRTTQRKSTMSSTTPDTLSLDSTTSAESKEQSSRSSHRAAAYLQQQQQQASIGPASLTDRHSSPAATHGGAGAGSNDHHHHFFSSGRQQLGSSQSNDDASSVLNRSSEEDSNDSAFADNGSMSLKTVTIALDHKLRSLRNSSVDSDRDVADTPTMMTTTTGTGTGGGGITAQDSDGSSSCCYTDEVNATPTRRSVHHSRPLTLGENIPYADESPERPLIQPRAKPLRQLSNSNANGNFVKPCLDKTSTNASSGNALNNNNSLSSQDDSVRSSLSQKSLDSGGGPNNSNDSCVTLINDLHDDLLLCSGGSGDADSDADKVNNISISSDDTDTSTTSNPREKLAAAASTYRIDNEVLKKMNRILTNLERKANNLERKFNLNRSLSLNYKNHKNLECCCGHHHGGGGAGSIVPGTNIPVLQCCNNNNNLHNHANNNNSVSVNNSLNVRSRLSLTKDEKTDKNINRRRQIHDVTSHGGCCAPVNGAGPQIILTPAATATTNAAPSSGRHRRQMGNRSIRRRHTVGGTHDYSAGNGTGKGVPPCQGQVGPGVCAAVMSGGVVGEDKGCKELN